jgi:hypothetical protein
MDPVAFFLSEGAEIVSEWNSRFQVRKIPSAPVLISPFVVRHQIVKMATLMATKSLQSDSVMNISGKMSTYGIVKK